MREESIDVCLGVPTNLSVVVARKVPLATLCDLMKEDRRLPMFRAH